MTALGTTTPPVKQKKSFGMRSILTVVGLSLFFIIAISGVLIAQRQRQVAEPVAPTAPVSRPSAAMPVEPPINACSKAFSIAFQSGQPIASAYACNTDCTDDAQCSAINANFICYRPNAGNGTDAWTAWVDSTEAIPSSIGAGTATGFVAFTRPDNSIRQFLVRGGKLFARTLTESGGWEAWLENDALNGIGSGTITSLSAFVVPETGGATGTIRQHAVIGGKVWTRDGANGGVNWSDWVEATNNFTGVGADTGVITGYSAYVMPDGKSIKQHLVRDFKLYVRNSDPTRTQWPNFVENSAANGVGSGDLTSFSAFIQKDKSIKQFIVRGGALAKRDNAGGKCRLASLPTAANCQGTTPTYSCGSTCTTDAQCQDTTRGGNAGYSCFGATGAKVCRLTANTASTTCQPVTPTYSCGSTCTTDTQCQDTTKGGNAGYSCFGATGAKVCRLTANTASTTCQPAAITYACNTACTTDAQCKTVNNDYICAADQGNRCRLDTNRGSATCAAPPKTYTCNATCDTTADCQSYNTNYVCYNAGGTTGKVCRLTGNETNTSCQSASAPPPAPAIGCNQICATNADCSNTAHICYDTALVGQTAGKVCRLANYVNSATCTTPSGSVTYTPPAETKGGQPALPAELPQTGPEDWLNWLKAGLITLGVGAALLLLL
ncbi:MAG: hypothetical protein A3A82_02720 [Candidatus Pacebacteria bacterium RIFCSPLOWO2_01_FULL_47_12]|nr:MAG: hypothetical protein A3A82_02720 [Candidatus Pacebacteria bacterium RIFCSPLOWO2_01_FULL_47_12]